MQLDHVKGNIILDKIDFSYEGKVTFFSETSRQKFNLVSLYSLLVLMVLEKQLFLNY